MYTPEAYSNVNPMWSGPTFSSTGMLLEGLMRLAPTQYMPKAKVKIRHLLLLLLFLPAYYFNSGAPSHRRYATPFLSNTQRNVHITIACHLPWFCILNTMYSSEYDTYGKLMDDFMSLIRNLSILISCVAFFEVGNCTDNRTCAICLDIFF